MSIHEEVYIVSPVYGATMRIIQLMNKPDDSASCRSMIASRMNTYQEVGEDLEPCPGMALVSGVSARVARTWDT